MHPQGGRGVGGGEGVLEDVVEGGERAGREVVEEDGFVRGGVVAGKAEVISVVMREESWEGVNSSVSGWGWEGSGASKLMSPRRWVPVMKGVGSTVGCFGGSGAVGTWFMCPCEALGMSRSKKLMSFMSKKAMSRSRSTGLGLAWALSLAGSTAELMTGWFSCLSSAWTCDCLLFLGLPIGFWVE